MSDRTVYRRLKTKTEMKIKKQIREAKMETKKRSRVTYQIMQPLVS
jgi:hypothetical protein